MNETRNHLADETHSLSSRWLYGFLMLQFACQAALVAPLGSARMLFRIATFASSLGMLVFFPTGGTPYPLRKWACIVLGIMCIGFLHPELNGLVVGIAAIAMCAAIWGPTFWVGQIHVTPKSLGFALLLMWGFHTASAIVGVLQVYDPERFAPDPSFIENLYGDFAEGLKLTLDDGRRIYRPFGLTDTPGGAAGSGAFAATVGLILGASPRAIWIRSAGILSTIVGMFCLYICQIRSALIVTGLGFVLIAVLSAWRGQFGKAAWLAGIFLAAMFTGFIWSTAVGGDAVTSRLESLSDDSAANVYYSNRGFFLEHTFTEVLPEYPLGAGLGRWGPIYGYFGNKENLDSPPIYVEIQATGWILDGGIFLLLVGYGAVIFACFIAVRIAIQTENNRFSNTAAVIAAMNFSSLVSTFGYPVFISQAGIMFWVLNAALYTASRSPPIAVSRVTVLTDRFDTKVPLRK